MTHPHRKALWGDVDPYGINVDRDDGPLGFDKRDALFKGLVDEHPGPVLEFGTFCGASALWIAQCGAEHVITVDSWNLTPEMFSHHPVRVKRYGRARDTFITFAEEYGLTDRVTYLPMTTRDAYEVLAEKGLRFAWGYVDAGHEYEDAFWDIEHMLDLVDGPIVVDDYEADRFPGVVQAVEDIASRRTDITVGQSGRKAVLWRR